MRWTIYSPPSVVDLLTPQLVCKFIYLFNIQPSVVEVAAVIWKQQSCFAGEYLLCKLIRI